MESKKVTKNGVQIYSYPNSQLHSFCASLYMRYGCLYESKEENGIAHFLEHIVFRNINSICGGELYHILDKNGLTFNASTYKEFIHFFITGSPAHFEEAAEILSKLLAPLEISKGELELERSRIKAEIREDDYRTSLDCFTNAVVWKGTPLTRSICRSCMSVDKIGKNKLEVYRKKLFSCENMFFYLTGAITDEQTHSLAQKVERYSPETGAANENIAQIPAGFGHRGGEVYLKNCTYSMVRFSFDIETSKYSDAAMELFFDVMFSGDSCVIFQNLSEKSGLVYGYDARFSKYNNIGNIYFSYEVKSSKLEETVRLVTESLRSLKNGITNELDYAVAPYVDNAMILFDNPEEFNWNRAYENHILDCGYKDIRARMDAYSSVTDDDIARIARDVLCADNMVLTLKGNKKKVDCNRLKEIISEI